MLLQESVSQGDCQGFRSIVAGAAVVARTTGTLRVCWSPPYQKKTVHTGRYGVSVTPMESDVE